MSHDEFRSALARLERWALRHHQEMARGEVLLELAPGELDERRRVTDYCRRNGLPVPPIAAGFLP